MTEFAFIRFFVFSVILLTIAFNMDHHPSPRPSPPHPLFNLFQVCCFETVGFDEYGEQVHSTIYPNLMTNVPKESMEYPDYTFQQHSEKTMPSYVDAKSVRDYLEGL